MSNAACQSRLSRSDKWCFCMADASPNKEGLCSAGVDTFVQKTSSFSDNTRSWARSSGDAHSFCSLWCRDKNAAVFLIPPASPCLHPVFFPWRKSCWMSARPAVNLDMISKLNSCTCPTHECNVAHWTASRLPFEPDE